MVGLVVWYKDVVVVCVLVECWSNGLGDVVKCKIMNNEV